MRILERGISDRRSFVLTFEISRGRGSLLVLLLAIVSPDAVKISCQNGVQLRSWRGWCLLFSGPASWSAPMPGPRRWSGPARPTSAAPARRDRRAVALLDNNFVTIVRFSAGSWLFMVQRLDATMNRSSATDEAGASLGAGPMLTFWRIFLPLSLPGVLAGSTLVFVLALGFYITPELLGGGRTIMISMLVSRNVELYDQWGAASAVGVVLLVAVGLIFFAVSRFIPLDRVLGQK